MPDIDVEKLIAEFTSELGDRGCGSLTVGICAGSLRAVLIRMDREEGAYSGAPCPSCSRIRMLKIGVCDKCYWDITTQDYATSARQRQADTGKA